MATKTNLVLVLILAFMAGYYFTTRGDDAQEVSGPAPRLFPEFNKEAADLIAIEGGWKERPYVFARRGSAWLLVSAGEFEAKAETADKLIDAVWNLRKQNPVSKSLEVRESTRTGEQGRLVSVYKGGSREGEPMAAVRIGKSPKGAYDVFFARREDGETVYRTRTLLTEDVRKAGDNPFEETGEAIRGFGWDTYLQSLSQWVETRIWSLGEAEESELMLVRPADGLNVRLVKKGQDDWQLTEQGKEPVAADVDAVRGITSQVRYLSFEEVVGPFDEVAEEYGLAEPRITLVMTLKKKVEKEDTEDTEGTEEGTEDTEDTEEEEKPAEEPKEEFKTFKRFIEVGNKVELPKYFDDETGEAETKEFYAIRVGGEFDEPEEEELSKYVYLVSDYTIGGLRKTLDELVAVEEAGEGDSEISEGTGEPAKEKEPAKESGEGDTEGSEGTGEVEGGDTESSEGTEEGAEEPAREEPAKEGEPEEQTGG